MNVYPILISGKQGSGKSTTTDVISNTLVSLGYTVYRAKFADTIYEIQDAALAVLKSRGITVPKKDGRLLQLLGTDWGRTVYGDDVWVNCTLGKFKELSNAGSAHPIIFILDDCRFQNELRAFKNFGFTVRLEADRDIRKARTDAWRDTETHISETDLDASLWEFNVIHKTDDPKVGLDKVATKIVGQFQAWVGNRQKSE